MITFLANGDLACANKEIERILKQWGISMSVNVGQFTPEQAEYLSYHNASVYKG